MEEEVAPVLKGVGEGGGDGGAGASEEGFEVVLCGRSPVAAQPVGEVLPGEHPCLDHCEGGFGDRGTAAAPGWSSAGLRQQLSQP